MSRTGLIICFLFILVTSLAGQEIATRHTGDGATDFISDQKNIIPKNTSPEKIADIPDQLGVSGFEKIEIILDNYFSDPDGDALIYNLSIENTDVVSLSESNGILYIEEAGIGKVTVVIDVTDDRGGFESDSFIVEVVNKPLRNQFPVVAHGIDDKELEAGFEKAQIILDSHFSDADNDHLSYTASAENIGIVNVSINENRLILQEVGVGQTIIKITADDGVGGSVSVTFVVKVFKGEANQAPVVVKSQEDINLKKDSSSEIIDLSEIFQDPDGDNMSYSLELSNQRIVQAELQGSELLLQKTEIGETQATVIASDQNGGEESISFNIQVSAVTNTEMASLSNWSTIYPNPANEFISFDISLEKDGFVAIHIFNTTGKQVMQSQFSSIHQARNIDISNLSSGLYIVKIQCNRNEMVMRFVKN